MDPVFTQLPQCLDVDEPVEVAFAVTIAQDGTVTTVEPLGEWSETDLALCVAQLFCQARFPRLSEPTYTTKFSFRLGEPSTVDETDAHDDPCDAVFDKMMEVVDELCVDFPSCSACGENRFTLDELPSDFDCQMMLDNWDHDLVLDEASARCEKEND